MSKICQSCKEERVKKGLPPMERIRLPTGITDKRNFKRPQLGLYVCRHCDGETLVTGALKSFEARTDS